MFERKRTQAVKPDHANLVIDGYKHTRDVPSLILACSLSEPAIEFGFATGERRPVMSRQRFDPDCHA